MKAKLLLLLTLLATLGVNAQTQRTINLQKAGTLDSFISPEEKYQITKLTLTGEINGKDFILLRDMGGASGISNSTPGQLAELDLSGAKIVASDDVYFSYMGVNHTTQEDVLGSYILYNCMALQQLYLPETLKELGDMPLSTTALTHLEIPQGVVTLGQGCFVGSDYIKSLTVPNSVTTLGTGAFQRMAGLEEITLGDGLKSLENSIFMGDEKLKKITFGAGLERFDPIIFSGLLDLEWIDVTEGNSSYTSLDGVLYSANMKDLICYPANLAGAQYAIPEGCVNIVELAFAGQKHLSKVVLPSTLESLAPGVLASIDNLLTIEVNPANPNWIIQDGMLYTKDLTTLVCVPGQLLLERYTAPETTTTIGDMAFARSRTLRYVDLKGNITSVGTGAFVDCGALERIVFGDQISYIGETICMGDSLLTSVYLYAPALSEEVVSLTAFFDEYVMERCTLYVPLGTLDHYNSQQWVYYSEEGETIPFFAAVEEFDTSIPLSVASVAPQEDIYPVAYYGPDGTRHVAPLWGINIVQMSDGSAQKIFVSDLL